MQHKNTRKRKLETVSMKSKRRKVSTSNIHNDSNGTEDVLSKIMIKCHSIPDLFKNELIFDILISCLPNRDIVCALRCVNKSCEQAIRNSRRIGFTLVTEYNDRMLQQGIWAGRAEELPDFNNEQRVCIHAKMGHTCTPQMRGLFDSRLVPCYPANDEPTTTRRIFTIMKRRYTDESMMLPILGSRAWKAMKRIIHPECIALFEVLQPWYAHFRPHAHVLETFDELSVHVFDRVEKKAWNFVQISVPEDTRTVEVSVIETPDESIRPTLQCVERVVRDFEERFCFGVWADLLEWRYFFIAGGALLSSVMNQSHLHQSMDVDIWCRGLSFMQWKKEVMAFVYSFIGQVIEETVILVDDPLHIEIKHHKQYVQTWVIDIDIRVGRTIVKLQFIWRGKYQNVGSILNGFDISAAQIGLGKTELGEYKLLVSTAFLHWAKTGFAISYKLKRNMDDMTMKRIHKYITRKEIIGWQLPKNCETHLFRDAIQDIEERGCLRRSYQEASAAHVTEEEEMTFTNTDEFHTVKAMLRLLRLKFHR